MKVALVYDWVDSWGGAERVLLALHKIFPQAPLYTSVYRPEKSRWAQEFNVKTSFLNKIPLPRRWLSPLIPLAFESFSFDQYDLVISISSFAAKGIICKPDTRHLNYLLTPTRFLWVDPESYLKKPNFLTKLPYRYLQNWDKIAAWRPDKIVTISQTVKQRCREVYQRPSLVIYPPVDLTKFHPGKNKKGDFYLTVSRLVAYKKIAIVIKAFRQNGRQLKIVGCGPQAKKLKKLARGQGNIEFLGRLTDKELVRYYQESQGVIFPAREDFGLVPVEAQACGTPVIAYRAGGAIETIIPGKTGELFPQQTAASLQKTISKFEQKSYNRDNCIRQAQKFSRKKFITNWQELLKNDQE